MIHGRTGHDGNVASFLGATDPLLELQLVARRSWDWQRNSCFRGKCFGAGPVMGIDNDPTAISMAKPNARLNRIRGASFQLGDVHKWDSAKEPDVITANLYSDSLIEMMPKLGGSAWLILSGILRAQQDDFVRAQQQNHLDIISAKRRRKWMAFLARTRRL